MPVSNSRGILPTLMTNNSGSIPDYSDPITKKIMDINQQLREWFQSNPQAWKSEADAIIEKCSEGKLRVFSTFFESPEQCLSGEFKIQGLEEKDLIAMYPKFIAQTKGLPLNTYCYLFSCNNAMKTENGRCALVSQSFIVI